VKASKNRFKQVAFAATLSTFIGLAGQAHAQQTIDVQQTVEEFLKPQITMRTTDYNLRKEDGNPLKPYRRECKQTNAQTISCTLFAPKLTSGGGDWYGPWFIVISDLAPIGYRFQSASFRMPEPRSCEGNDNSPIKTCGDKCGQSNPDDLWSGHKNGNGSKDAKCFIFAEDTNRVTWIYGFRGEKGSVSVIPAPFAGNSSVAQIDTRRDGPTSEAAELDVVYVKID